MQKCQDCQNVLEKNEPKKLDQINKNTTLRSHSEMDKNIFIIMFFYKGTPLQSNLGRFRVQRLVSVFEVLQFQRDHSLGRYAETRRKQLTECKG